MLKYPKDKATGEYDRTKKPTLKVKVPQWEGVWKSEIYDEDGEKLFPCANSSVTPIDFLKKGANIMCIIQFAGIWFVNGKFSASWKLVQAAVQKPKPTLYGQCFIKLKTADKEKLKALPPVEHDDIDPDGAVATIVDDSDDDEGVEDKPQKLRHTLDKRLLGYENGNSHEHHLASARDELPQRARFGVQ
jgi:hypothetical protein